VLVSLTFLPIMKELALRNPHVAKAAQMLGGVQQLADALEISRSAIYQWDTDEVPPKRAREIEKLTNGKVTRRDLCPSIFSDDEDDEAPQDEVRQ
jgi:DNA-binding transcriptional regulator YdaS (Cro superfamily)